MKISPKIVGAVVLLGVAAGIHLGVIFAGQAQLRTTAQQLAIGAGPETTVAEKGRASAATDRRRQQWNEAVEDVGQRAVGSAVLLVGLVAAAGCYLFRRCGRLRDTGEEGPGERERMLESINANLGGTCVYRTIHTPEGRRECVYVSPNVEALTGLSVEQVLADAERVFALIHPEDLPSFQKTMREAWAEEAAASVAVRMRPVGGGEIYALFQSRLAERRADGTQVRDGVVFDLTAVRHTETELRAVRQRLELALRASRTCIWEDDLAANRIRLDSMWAEMRGYPAGETVSTWRGLLAGAHPEDRPAIMAAARRAVQGETDDYQIEQRVRTADGDWIWILSHGRVVERDARGRACRILGTNTDITARTRVEAQLQRQATFLGALNETTLDLLNRRDFPDLLRALIERAAVLLDAPHVELLLKEGGELVVHAATHGDRAQAGGRVSREEAPLSWQAVESGQTVVVAEAPAGTARPNRDGLPGRKSGVELPILRGAEPLGVISLTRSEANRPFTAEDIRRGEMLARQAALVLHNATIRADAAREAEARTVALRESEERHRAVFEHSPMIIGLLSVPEGRLVEFNAAGLAAFGYAREEVIGRTSLDLNVWVDLADRDRYLTELRAHGRVVGFETQMRRKNGEVFTVLYNGNLIEIGGRLYSLNSLDDITARRRAEGALRKSQEQLRLVWESATDGMRLTDGEGKVVAVNAAFCRMVGKVQAEIEGRPMPAVYAETERERIFKRYRERFARRDVAGISEHHVTLWDGRGVLLEVSNCFIESDPAQPLMLGVFRDITERRRVEHEREKMQTRLVQNQKLEALGTLAGGVAHDFNNILAGMLNYTVLAREDCPPAQATIREYLDEVLKGGHRAKELVRQILLLSRSEAAARAPLQLALVAREALSLLRSTIPAAVEIVSEIDPQAPAILANATQVHQVIMNLGINAAHAMRAHGGTLTVRVRERRVDLLLAAEIADLEPGAHVWMEVSDTGCGMEPAVAERIFEPFFTTKQVGEGTGLGLAVVRSVVRSHRGALTMRTRPGVGTTFELYFPVPAAAVPVAAPAPAKEAFARGQGQRILVVDDETMVARSMQMVMERLGYQVTVFNRPEEGLARFEAAPADFDLVITDFQMPGMTGIELAVRALAARPGIGVFISSGFAGSLTDDQVRDLGIAGLIRKPVEMGELAELLARFFAPRG